MQRASTLPEKSDEDQREQSKWTGSRNTAHLTLLLRTLWRLEPAQRHEQARGGSRLYVRLPKIKAAKGYSRITIAWGYTGRLGEQLDDSTSREPGTTDVVASRRNNQVFVMIIKKLIWYRV